MIMKRINNKKGFTLVELLIVIAVLGIIAGIGVTSMSGVTKTFKEKADVETARMVARQIEIQVMAGELSLPATTAQVDTAITDAYPTPQLGGAFTFAVAADGVVTVIANSQTIASSATTDADITISTKKVQ